MNHLLNKIFQRSKHEDLNTNQMWFLDSDISSNEFNLSPPIYQALLDIKNNGVAILRSNNSDASCDSLLVKNPRLLAKPNYKTISFIDHLMIDQGSPKFFHNKFEGNFKEID